MYCYISNVNLYLKTEQSWKIEYFYNNLGHEKEFFFKEIAISEVKYL